MTEYLSLKTDEKLRARVLDLKNETCIRMRIRALIINKHNFLDYTE